MEFQLEDAVVLRCQCSDSMLVQLGATQAVVWIRLKCPLPGSVYSELHKRAIPDSPAACKVLLGTFDMASMRYRACELYMEQETPVCAELNQETVEPPKAAASHGRHKVFKRPKQCV